MMLCFYTQNYLFLMIKLYFLLNFQLEKSVLLYVISNYKIRSRPKWPGSSYQHLPKMSSVALKHRLSTGVVQYP